MCTVYIQAQRIGTRLASYGHRERTVKLDKSANIVMAILSPFQNVIHLMER